jgi:hypothetical protein
MSTIINNSFFKGDIYLPQARPTISAEVSDIDQELIDFIHEYEEECLSSCLGGLYLEFKSNLDLSKPNGLVDLADEKWDWLLNGRSSYVDQEGKVRSFKGIRYKTGISDEYDKSLIAYYIYYNYKRSNYVSSTGIGDSIPKARNAEVVTPNIKTNKAWRSFYKLVVGEANKPKVYFNKHGYGIDYYRPSNLYVSLYKFIEDMNAAQEGFYDNFEPKEWDNVNLMGI